MAYTLIETCTVRLSDGFTGAIPRRTAPEGSGILANSAETREHPAELLLFCSQACCYLNTGHCRSRWVLRAKVVRTRWIWHLYAVVLAFVVSCSADASAADETNNDPELGAGVTLHGELSVSSASLVEHIDEQLRQAWSDNEIRPSEVATDAEWVRRIYLDLCGRIPRLEEVRSFLDDKTARKRLVLVAALLAHQD